MAVLPPHLPVLYCMLCYSAERSNNNMSPSDRLLNDMPESKHNPNTNSDSPSDFIPTRPRSDNDNIALAPDSFSGAQIVMEDRPGPQNRLWKWYRLNGHNRGGFNLDLNLNFDLEELCKNNASFRIKPQNESRHRRKKHFIQPDKSKSNRYSECLSSQPNDIRKMFPNGFLSIEELMRTLPHHAQQRRDDKSPHSYHTQKPVRRFRVDTGLHQDLQFSTHNQCGPCFTWVQTFIDLKVCRLLFDRIWSICNSRDLLG